MDFGLGVELTLGSLLFCRRSARMTRSGGGVLSEPRAVPTGSPAYRIEEGLYFEEVGPKTILVTSRLRGTSIPQIGVGTTLLTLQLAQYFGVEGGVLINNVRRDSPGAKAGLKAADVIVAIDDEPVRGALGLIGAIDDKKENDFSLTIVRGRKDQPVRLRLNTVSP